MKKSILKKAGAAALVSAMVLSLAACNKKIEVDYGYNPSDYVELGEYKGIQVSVDTQKIEDDLINQKVLSDQEENTTYYEVSRAAQDKDQVTITATATVGGTEATEFECTDNVYIIGKDAAVVDGFIESAIGMKAGETKVVTLTIPETFTDEPDYAGKRIVYNITCTLVEQPSVPMITDAYAKEYFDCDTVDAYKEKIKNDIQSAIDDNIKSAQKKEVLTTLSKNCKVNSYPQDLLEQKTSEFDKSISFYSTMLGQTTDEYCQTKFGISFDEYVKNAVGQQLIMQTIAQKENISISEYDYKGDLADFALEQGYNNKESFEEKFGKDLIVKNMIVSKAQNIVMDSAIYN